ncbi:cell division protein PerM [Curtobacterium sp. SP.BCo]|uniref:cell division protein PerM n=1 Tax=Curtobacterium sp. SP.BCo TaxID=3435229 RepID=UPI003F73651E
MNRLGTALLAAIEAVVTVGVGLGIALVPLTLLWGFEYGLQIDWDVFWKATGSVWLIGHGVDVSFLLGAALAKSSGVSGATDPIHVTLAALGFAIVTAWLAGRAGRRFAETEHRTIGLLVGTAVVAALGLAVALSSRSAATVPVLWQAVVLPALWFGIPALVTSEVCRRRRGLPADPVTQRLLDQLDRVPAAWRAVAAFGLRAGTAATAAVIAVAGIVVAFLLFGSFAEVIALYERSHAGVVGGIALTVGQLAFLPDFVGWATSWLVGPGFAIGTGSSVSPIGTVLGPIPGIPVFGALPASGHAFGLVWVLVPVLAGFAVGGLLRPRLVQALGTANSALHRALGGVAAGVVAGVLTGMVAWLTSGSFGPGRLAEVGPHALLVGAFAALEVGVPAVVALAAGSDLVRLPERGWTRERWHEAEDETDAEDTGREGSLLAALDQAGAGRTTDVHRFVVEETHGAPRPTDTGEEAADAGAARDSANVTDQVTEPIHDHARDRRRSPAPEPSGPTEPSRASRPDREPDPDADVELPDWARTDVVASERVDDRPAPAARGGVGAIRDRLRGAAGGVRDRAGELRDRVTGADAERDQPRPTAAPTPTAPGTEAQPAFPWSTEEFVAGRDDDDADDPAPAPEVTAPATQPRWDATDQIPEDELPWWRRPKGDRERSR